MPGGQHKSVAPAGGMPSGDDKHLRFCQLIEILNGHTDYFYEEPEATFERWNKVIKQLKYEHNNIPTAGKADASR